MNKGIRKYTTWKIGDYVLQLSVVVIGIVVTFAGSNALEERAKAKELVQAMQIVKSELELNRQEVIRVTGILQNERNGCSYLLHYKDHIRDANPDTLRMYLYTPFISELYAYTDDALEMLKASSLVQQIQNKETVLQLIKAYNKLKSVDEIFRWYYNSKEKEADLITKDPDFVMQNTELMKKGDIYEVWKYRFTNFHLNTILRIAAFGAGFEETFQEAQDALSDAIMLIDKEYNLK